MGMQVANTDAILAAMSLEYAAMRDEIGRLIEHEERLVQLGFLVLGLTLAFIGALLGPDSVNADAALILLLVPFVYLLFSLSAAEQTRRILQIARYIADNLTPRAEQFTGGARLWQWETFKIGEYERLDGKGRARVWVLERSRWISLTVPSVIALTAYGSLVGYQTAPARILGVVDVFMILFQIAVLMTTTEAPGLRKRRPDEVPS